MRTRKTFQNFEVDHMTLLVQPQLYNVAYVLFNVIFGVGPEDILYEKRRPAVEGYPEESMTFAMQIGTGLKEDPSLKKTIIAV
ncbi:MAG: hypothetical protein ABL958_20370, partial [Bdellovibrionia bacterium]